MGHKVIYLPFHKYLISSFNFGRLLLSEFCRNTTYVSLLSIMLTVPLMETATGN